MSTPSPDGTVDVEARQLDQSEATWLWELLGIAVPPEEGRFLELDGRQYVFRGGILRESATLSTEQAQTADVFGFKWRQRHTFETEAMRAKARTWMVEKYGDVASAHWWEGYGPDPLVLDAGCGAALSALELFGDRAKLIRYLGVDVSDAVDAAAARCAERGVRAAFLQADLTRLPLPPESVDVIFSEGVLHHTDSTRNAIRQLAQLLKKEGRFLFYVYRRKSPVREFTDDYIRGRLADCSPDEAWDLLLPLTRLGKALGEGDVEIEIPEPIDLLGIPAGRTTLHRLFYWHFCKAFHHPDFSLDELNHINFDWYAPRNAHRQTPEQVRAWCAEAGLHVEREHLQESGITIVARRP